MSPEQRVLHHTQKAKREVIVIYLGGRGYPPDWLPPPPPPRKSSTAEVVSKIVNFPGGACLQTTLGWGMLQHTIISPSEKNPV